jgi:hypothetical protein
MLKRTYNNRSGVLFGSVLRPLLGSAPMDLLGSDHGGPPTDTHATMEELCFLCVVRAEEL